MANLPVIYWTNL